MKIRSAWRQLWAAAFALFALAAGETWAAYDCFVTVTSIGTIHESGNGDDTSGSATLTCTRAGDDANTLTYRLRANNGLYPNGTQRRARHATSAATLDYSLSSGACANNTNWYDPSNYVTGTLNFGSALTASTTIGLCIRNQPGNVATSGIYSDTVSVAAQYPNSDAGALTVPAFLTYTVGVDAQCVFHTYPGTMAFSYTSFSPTPQTASQAIVLRCSNNLPWSIAVTPSTSTVLGLDYSIAATPASGTGNGNIGQTVTLTGTIPAGQAGTCALGTCTATKTHTVIISY